MNLYSFLLLGQSGQRLLRLAEDLDEPDSRLVIELVALVIGGQVEVVQRVGGFPRATTLTCPAEQPER